MRRRPIEGATPAAETELAAARRMEFEVEVLQPVSHALEVSWWVLPERAVPAAPGPLPSANTAPYGTPDRTARGPLAALAGEPEDTGRVDRKGRASFKLDATELEPGRYRVIARVRDDAQPKGEKRPWVVRDEHQLLASERGWWVVVP